MSKVAYLSLLIYIPILIGMMMLTSDRPVWDAVWFASDKAMMCVLLLAIREREIIRNRRAMFGGAAVAMAIYTIYLAVDWQGTNRANIIFVMILSATFIFSILYTLFKNDR